MTASVSGSVKDRVLIFDTTLRDGEQCPGATMTLEEKLEVAELLDAMGVDIIEAGFPIASNGDFEAVALIAKRVKNATVAGLARAISADIARAGEAVRHAARPRIHTFVSTSPIHLAHQMRKTEEEVLEIITDDGDPGPQPGRGRRVVRHGRHPHPDRLSVPLRRSRDQGRRHHHQPARHGRLCHAGRIPRHVPRRARARAECRQGDLLGPLPQRSRPRRRQLPGGAGRRRAAGRMHHQRHRRAGRQRGAGRDRHGDPDPRRRAALRDRHRGDHADPRLEARLGRDLVPGAVQQGDRRPERLRARERHPPGRHAEERPDLRDHDAGKRRRVQDLARHGQAFGPRRLPQQAGGAGLQPVRQPVPGCLRALQGTRRPQEARLRRGHRGAGRPEHRHGPRPHQAGLALTSSPAPAARSAPP